MKILHQVRDAIAAKIAAAVPDVDLVALPTEGEPPAGVEGEVLLAYPWGMTNLSAVLRRGVRWVHVLGTGVDAFPLHLLTGQALTCSRGASAVPISEWTLAVMLAFEKRLPEAWVHSGWTRIPLGTLHGKTLGLVGLGAIGAAVARRALPFGMRVLAVRRSGASSGIDGVEVVASIGALVEQSDHVVIAAPATAATHHLFDRALLARMKRGAHLVNVSRGALVDQEALREALDEECIAMASLDAVEPEPLPPGHWLYTHPRVRLSPHGSWNMPGAADLLVEPFVDNLRRYREGQPLQGIVDVEEGY